MPVSMQAETENLLAWARSRENLSQADLSKSLVLINIAERLQRRRCAFLHIDYDKVGTNQKWGIPWRRFIWLAITRRL